VKELFEMQQLNQLNVILNGVQTSNRSSAYGYGYGYNYGYGYYEGDEEIDKGNLLNRLWSFIRSKFKR
jgi:hypothetical protein